MPKFIHSANEPASQGAIRTRCGVIVTYEDAVGQIMAQLLTDEPPPIDCPDCEILQTLDFDA